MGLSEKRPYTDVQDQDTLKSLLSQSVLLNMVIPEGPSQSEEEPSLNDIRVDSRVNALEVNQANQSKNKCPLIDPYFEMSLPFDTLPKYKIDKQESLKKNFEEKQAAVDKSVGQSKKRDKQSCLSSIAIESKKRKVKEPLNHNREIKTYNEESKYKFHAFASDEKQVGFKKTTEVVIKKVRRVNETPQPSQKKLKESDLFRMPFQTKDDTQFAKQFTMKTKDKKIWQSSFSLKSQMK